MAKVTSYFLYSFLLFSSFVSSIFFFFLARLSPTRCFISSTLLCVSSSFSFNFFFASLAMGTPSMQR